MIKEIITYNFLKLLDDKLASWHYENDWIIVDGDVQGNVKLYGYGLTSLPDNIKFNNKGIVWLDNNDLISLPDNIEFNNDDTIYLYNNDLKTLPNNLGDFYDRLDDQTKEYIVEKFPRHPVIIKRKFGL